MPKKRRLATSAAALLTFLAGSLTGSLLVQTAQAADPIPCATPTTPAVEQPVSTEAAQKLGWGVPRLTDEFNYVGAPDSTKWSVYNSAGHSGNGLRRPAQWAANGEYLRVTGLTNGTTGGMSSKLRGTTYGRWEARMRVPQRDVDYHPVLIVWPDAGRTSATSYEEIDFSEANSLGSVKFYLHAASGSTGTTSASRMIDQTQWHNYAVDWQPGRITGYIDGVKWFEDTASNAAKVKYPAHLTMQLDWFPKDTTTVVSYMDVDWARIYPR